MTTTALGADPDQLDALSRQLHRAAGDLRRSEREVDRLVKDTAWKGSRAAKFTQTWPGAAGRQLREAAAALDTMSDSAKRNADEQRQASGATSSQPFPSLAALTAAGLTIGVAGSTAKHMGLDRFLEGKGSSSVDGGLSISRGTTGEHSFFTRGAQGSTRLGSATASGSLSSTFLGETHGADAHASLGSGGLDLGAGANASAVIASVAAAGALAYGPLTADVSGTASAGAEAQSSASLRAGPGGVGVGASASGFVGGKVEGSASLDAGGVKGTAGGSLRAGIGGEASGDLTLGQDGVHVKAKLGLAIGVGGSLNFDVAVNPAKVISGVSHLIHNPFD